MSDSSSRGKSRCRVSEEWFNSWRAIFRRNGLTLGEPSLGTALRKGIQKIFLNSIYTANQFNGSFPFLLARSIKIQAKCLQISSKQSTNLILQNPSQTSKLPQKVTIYLINRRNYNRRNYFSYTNLWVLRNTIYPRRDFKLSYYCYFIWIDFSDRFLTF